MAKNEPSKDKKQKTQQVKNECFDNFDNLWYCEYCAKSFIDEEMCQYHENTCNCRYQYDMSYKHKL